MIKVSIIIPVYNVEKYIERCLRSVIAQTYKGTIECIWVDDCTPDQSIRIVGRILENYTGCIEFRIIRHDQNKGLSAARNTGIKNASGEYLYFLDSDDEITPDAIEKLVELVCRYPKVDMVIGNLYAADSMRFLFVPDRIKEYYTGNKQVQKLMLKEGQLPITAWNKLVNKEFLLINHLFFEEGLLHEDQIWNFFMAKVVCSLAICHAPTYIYYINDSSIMSQVSVRRIDSYLKILDIFFHNITDSRVFLQYKKGVNTGVCILSMFLHVQDRSLVTNRLRQVKKQFLFTCSNALKHFHLFSFIYLLIFIVGLSIYPLVRKFLQR